MKTKRITYDDICDPVTVTVADLADAFGKHPDNRHITVRLRSATIAMFKLGGVMRQESGHVWLSVGGCLNNARISGGSYGNMQPGHLIDVAITKDADPGFWRLIERNAVPVRGWRDMFIEDMHKPYEESRWH